MWARRFAPNPPREIDKPHQDNALALADSEFATEAAIAQAADEKRVDRKGKDLPADFQQLRRTLARSERQATRAKDLLPDQLWVLVLPALHWIEKQRDWLAAMTDTRHVDLTPVIEGQSEILFEAVGAITEVAGMADNKALQGGPNPVLDVLREYAVAAGESHLIDSARQHLTRARRAKADMPLALMEQAARDTSVAVDDFVGQGHGDWAGNDVQRIDINRRVISDMRRRQADGEKLDAGWVAFTAATVKEQAVDVRGKSLYNQLSDLGNYARDSQFGFFETMSSLFDSNIRSLPGKIMEVMTDLRETVIDPHARAKERELSQAKDDAGRALVLGNVTRSTEKAFADFVERHDLKRRMGMALALIEKQERRTAVIRIVTQIVILIGASVVGGIAGNMVAGAVRGAMVADAATASLGMLRASRVVGTVAGLTVDAGINAGTQLAVQGGDTQEAFIGNFLGSAAVRVALAPLSRAAQAWGIAGEEAKAVEKLNVWQKAQRGGKVVLHEGAVLTTSMITAAATEYVVHRIYHSKEPPTEKQALDWAIQGGSMAVGSFIGKWAHGFESRAVQFAEHQGQLFARARKMQRLANELTKTGDDNVALDLLVQRQDALQEEARLIDELTAKLATDPNSVHMTRATLDTLRMGNKAESAAVRDAAFDMVPLRLGGLAPDDASGTLWTGHRAQIDTGLEKARRAGIDVQMLGHDPATKQWRVRYNGKEITIVEIQQKSAVILAGDDAQVTEAAANIKPLAGYQDVVVHGTIDDFEVIINGKTLSVDHRSLATYILKNGGGNQKIRLLSCETGKHAKGAAQHLANKLGVEVMAPNDLLHVFEDGSLVIGPKPDRNTGSWETFTPKKASRRYSQPKERGPERAIDRLNRTRAERAGEGDTKTLGDDSVERGPLHAKSDLGDAMVTGRDYAERAASHVGGHLEATVQDVALKSVASDIQIESGLRVLDGVFGEVTSAALRDGAKAIAREADSALQKSESDAFVQLNSERKRLQKEMLDVLRDPAIDINKRKLALHALLDQFQDAVQAVPKVNGRKIKFGDARKAIDALRTDAFENMMAVDAAGNMTQAGRPAGTLRDLMNNVRETNAAFARHGIAEEFVISVSSPRDPAIPREVKVLKRKPRDLDDLPLGAKRQKRSPVDPSDASEEGIVVDIGVGLTDYAREVGGEQGEVVKTEFGPNYADPAMQRRDLTWEHTAPRVDVDSVVVLGDALQTLPMMFAGRSVKRLFINNINAHYADGGDSYLGLARGLREVMTSGGRVEVQWTTKSETTAGKTQPRGHITGEGLKRALTAAAKDVPRNFSVNESAPPVTDYNYSVEAPRGMTGEASKTPPSSPVPEKRWIFTFED